MANFVSKEIMGTTLEVTERYSKLEPQGIGASGVIWYGLVIYIVVQSVTNNYPKLST
jgi:hypothetical protein